MLHGAGCECQCGRQSDGAELRTSMAEERVDSLVAELASIRSQLEMYRAGDGRVQQLQGEVEALNDMHHEKERKLEEEVEL